MLEMRDLQHIADELEFDIQDVTMLIDVFVTNTEELLHSLEKSIINNDTENILKFTHTIKGSASNLTLNNIVDLSIKIELETQNFNGANNLKLYEELKNAVERLK